MKKNPGSGKADTTDWVQASQRVGQVFAAGRLHPSVDAWIREEAGEGPWAVACSGGADSVCLVLLLYAHFSEYRGRIKVLHFNHRLRGEASDGDEEFVRVLADGLGLDFFCDRWEREGSKSPNEGEAREARFTFLHMTMDGLSARMLFLGHQMEDIGETMLMRLARGSGTAGLAAPRPVHKFGEGRVHLRPLLDITKSDIVKTLRQNDIPWREDSSNLTEDFTRNRLRRTVLPAWQEAVPHDVHVGAAQSRALLEEDDKALEEWLDSIMPAGEFPGRLDLVSLVDKPRALYRRALRRWLALNGLGGVLSRDAFESLLEAACANMSFRASAGADCFVEIKSGRLALERRKPRPEWSGIFAPFGGWVFLPCGGVLRVEEVKLDAESRAGVLDGKVDPRHEAYLACRSEFENGVLVRLWQPGDRYRPLGASGTIKLQDQFTNRKIKAVERMLLPVVCLKEETIVWCPGLPPADDWRIKGRTDNALRLTFTPGPAELQVGN